MQEDDAARQAPPAEVVGEVGSDPVWGGAGDQIDKGGLDDVLALGLGALDERRIFAIPKFRQHVDEEAVPGIEEGAELADSEGHSAGLLALLVEDRGACGATVEGVLGAGYPGHELLPGSAVGAKHNPFDTAQELGSYVDGGRLLHEARRSDQDDVPVGVPTEGAHLQIAAAA